MNDGDPIPDLPSTIDNALQLLDAIRWTARSGQALPAVLLDTVTATIDDLQWWKDELERKAELDALSAIAKHVG